MVELARSELFDADFLEAVRQLRLVASRVPSGGRFAEQRSQTLGQGIEFRDFRPYTPGDDLRGVDWNIYRRLGRVFLRLFEEQEDLPVYLLPDLSMSGFVQEGAHLRAHVGLKTAMALGAIALGQHDSVGVFPVGQDVSIAMPPTSGANRLLHLAERLSTLEAGGGTRLAHCLERFGAMNLRRGLLVLISDFFDPAGIDDVVRALKTVRHKLLLVHLWRATDAEPNPADFAGDVRLVDAEGASIIAPSGHLDMYVDDEVRARYRAAFQAFEASLHTFAASRQAGYLKLDVESDVVAQLATLFESGRLRA